MSKVPAVGIDLGTSYSSVGVFRHGYYDIIANDQGNPSTPSYVAFTDTECLIGDAAKFQGVSNHVNTVFNAKRLIGRKFDDPIVQSDLKHWPFKIVNDGGKPKLHVEYKGEVKTLFPEQILSMILNKLKYIASEFLQAAVKDVVITVPAYFNISQRQAIKDAGTICGLNVLQIISESTAAAIGYGLGKKFGGEHNILIFNLGGGSCDVSVLTIDDGIFEVKSTAGFKHLGGEDFNKRMVNHFLQEFRQKYNKDPIYDKRSLTRLHSACERAKHILSSSTEATIEIDALYEGIDFYTSITRVRFEELCDDLFHRTLEPVEKSLCDAKMDKSAIHEVVLVGGSTCIPKIQKNLQNFFNGKELNKSINPFEAATYGAAIYAAILSCDYNETLENILLLDVIPLSLGIETAGDSQLLDTDPFPMGTKTSGGVITPLIKRNTTIPAKQTRIFSTFRDNQHSVLIKVYEGEHTVPKNNHLLGKFELKGIPPEPRGIPQIEVTFNVDNRINLNVSAVNRSAGNESKITITNENCHFSKKEIEAMVQNTEKMFADGNRYKERFFSAKNSTPLCCNMNSAGEDNKLRDKVIETCNEAFKWLDANQHGKKDEYEYKQKEIEQICNFFITKMNQITTGAT